MPLLKKAAAGDTSGGLSMSRAGVVNISSIAGSIEKCASATFTVYRGSKVSTGEENKWLDVINIIKLVGISVWH